MLYVRGLVGLSKYEEHDSLELFPSSRLERGSEYLLQGARTNTSEARERENG